MLSSIWAGLKAIPALIAVIHDLQSRIAKMEQAFNRWRDEEFFRESRRLRELAENAKTAEDKHEAAKLAASLLSKL